MEGGQPHRAFHSYAVRLRDAVRDFADVLGPGSSAEALALADKLTQTANASTDVESDRGVADKPKHPNARNQHAAAFVLPAVSRHYQGE